MKSFGHSNFNCIFARKWLIDYKRSWNEMEDGMSMVSINSAVAWWQTEVNSRGNSWLSGLSVQWLCLCSVWVTWLANASVHNPSNLLSFNFWFLDVTALVGKRGHKHVAHMQLITQADSHTLGACICIPQGFVPKQPNTSLDPAHLTFPASFEVHSERRVKKDHWLEGEIRMRNVIFLFFPFFLSPCCLMESCTGCPAQEEESDWCALLPFVKWPCQVN